MLSPTAVWCTHFAFCSFPHITKSIQWTLIPLFLRYNCTSSSHVTGQMQSWGISQGPQDPRQQCCPRHSDPIAAVLPPFLLALISLQMQPELCFWGPWKPQQAPPPSECFLRAKIGEIFSTRPCKCWRGCVRLHWASEPLLDATMFRGVQVRVWPWKVCPRGTVLPAMPLTEVTSEISYYMGGRNSVTSPICQ